MFLKQADGMGQDGHGAGKGIAFTFPLFSKIIKYFQSHLTQCSFRSFPQMTVF